ncbi:hypothetical protein OSTOST_03177 [Ostertagia ostertagi]
MQKMARSTADIETTTKETAVQTALPASTSRSMQSTAPWIISGLTTLLLPSSRPLPTYSSPLSASTEPRMATVAQESAISSFNPAEAQTTHSVSSTLPILTPNPHHSRTKIPDELPITSHSTQSQEEPRRTPSEITPLHTGTEYQTNLSTTSPSIGYTDGSTASRATKQGSASKWYSTILNPLYNVRGFDS